MEVTDEDRLADALLVLLSADSVPLGELLGLAEEEGDGDCELEPVALKEPLRDGDVVADAEEL